MRWTRFGDRGGSSAAPGKRQPPARTTLPDWCERLDSPLPEAAEFAAKLLDVLRVLADRFLVRLQSIQHSSVIALAAVANSFLLGELLLGVGEQLLLVLEFRLQDLAADLLSCLGKRRRLCKLCTARRDPSPRPVALLSSPT